MARDVIFTKHAPMPIGPYSQGIRANGHVYVAGQGGVLPGPEPKIAGETIEAQTEQALNNIAAILTAAGTNMAHVVSVTVLLADMADFAAMNAVYATFFPTHPPARATYAAKELPLKTLVEIVAVAVMPE
jgi:2-iminobutanoate/2-iminopropanoate deaminase